MSQRAPFTLGGDCPVRPGLSQGSEDERREGETHRQWLLHPGRVLYGERRRRPVSRPQRLTDRAPSQCPWLVAEQEPNEVGHRPHQQVEELAIRRVEPFGGVE